MAGCGADDIGQDAGPYDANTIHDGGEGPVDASLSLDGGVPQDAMTDAAILDAPSMSGDAASLDAATLLDAPIAIDALPFDASLPMVDANLPMTDASQGIPDASVTTWDNVTMQAGLHVGGPAFGRGAAWVDVDSDGRDDLWLADSGLGLPNHTNSIVLYRNLGAGSFTPFSLGIPAPSLQFTWVGAWADYDNDGDPDLFLARGGYDGMATCKLYRNDLANGGGFVDVSSAAGISTLTQDWWGASYADYDGDGFLDLIVTARTDPLILYRNRGDGTFDDTTSVAGLGTMTNDFDRKNPVWLDFDRDGDTDLYIAGRGSHHLFRNDSGSFVEVTSLAFSSMIFNDSLTDEVFVTAVEDFGQDGWDDLYLGRSGFQDYVALNQGNGTFQAVGSTIGIDTGFNENTMGLQVGDIDGNGYPDVLIGTGNPMNARLPVLFCNQGNPLLFVRCGQEMTMGHLPSRHHGIALGDMDHDGDVDVAWNLGGPAALPATADRPVLYRRQAPLAGNTATLRLIGSVSNRDAIGARLQIVGTTTHYYGVRNAQGFQNLNSRWLVVTLGTASTASVTVTWPSGAISNHSVAAGQRLDITE